MNHVEIIFWFYCQSEAQKQLEAIKIFRAKMKEVADEARQKDDLYKQLVSTWFTDFRLVGHVIALQCPMFKR